jgi:hypothetical protein
MTTRKNRTRKQKQTKRVFSKNDYAANDGMVSSVWGPPFWHYLHTMSFNYPVEPTMQDKKHYRNFILSLKYVLPCRFCRQNIRTNFKHLPLTMDQMKNRDTFSRYVYDLHELVNKMLKKESGLSYADVRERYENFRSRCTDEKPLLYKFTSLSKTRKNKNKKEKGCTTPLYGKKSKCIVSIVPHEERGESFQIDKKCIKTRE